MSPKMGRPTEDPKTLSTRIRMSEDDVKRLSECSTILGKSKADVIRQGVKELHERLTKK